MYVTTISLPLSFEADSDDQARLIVEHLTQFLAAASLPHETEIYDAPHVEALEESLPYHALRAVYTDNAADNGRFTPTVDGAAGDCLDCAQWAVPAL